LKRWLWHKAQSSMDLARLVFVDESGAKTNMTRLYGRAKAGQRAVDSVPSGHWSATTMISPDLNPIENIWSKVKSILRRFKTRTREALIDGIAGALEMVTAGDAEGWFESCGYTNTIC
jgi:hypothetical protein